MTYEDWIIAVAAESPRLSGSALKLLLHLASVSIQTGTNQVRLSDRELETQLDICRPALTDAKKTLGPLVQIDARAGVPSLFTLPVDWFPGQRALFSPQVARFSSHQWPGKLATAGQESLPPVASLVSHSGQENLPRGQESWPLLANKTGQVANKVSHSGQESWPPPTQNQQFGAAPSIESNRSEVVVTREVIEKIDRALDAVEIPGTERPFAETLRNHLQEFLQQRGTAGAGLRPPKDELLAKCFACGPIDSLLMVLGQLSNQTNIRPGSYIWFVVVFLDHLHGIPWKQTKTRMDQRRQRKAPGRAEALPFPAADLRQAVNNIKSLR